MQTFLHARPFASVLDVTQRQPEMDWTRADVGKLHIFYISYIQVGPQQASPKLSM